MIRCAHCHNRHATVAEVRACSQAQGQPRPDPGRYAVELGDKLRFFIVTGKRFSEQAGPNTYPVHPNGQAAIFQAIMKDPLAALFRYGRELKICGACGLPLTKKTSRDRGMGDICWGKRGAA